MENGTSFLTAPARARRMAARGARLAAFDGRSIPVRGVAPPSNTGGSIGHHAFHPATHTTRGGDPGFHPTTHTTRGGNPGLPTGRLDRPGATPGAHHGLPGQRGFTLIELLVVLSLISILAAMGMVQHKNSVLKAQEATLKTDLFHMRDAIDQYYADKGKYPASLDALVTDNYLRKVPVDPVTRTADSWETVPAEADPNNPSAEPGIYNIKSTAPGTALDGTSYADW